MFFVSLAFFVACFHMTQAVLPAGVQLLFDAINLGGLLCEPSNTIECSSVFGTGQQSLSSVAPCDQSTFSCDASGNVLEMYSTLFDFVCLMALTDTVVCCCSQLYKLSGLTSLNLATPALTQLTSISIDDLPDLESFDAGPDVNAVYAPPFAFFHFFSFFIFHFFSFHFIFFFFWLLHSMLCVPADF
jgi:hypothetical protein